MTYPLVIAYRYKIYNNEFDLTGGDVKKIKIHLEPGLDLDPDTVYHWDGKSLFSNFEAVNNGHTDLDAAIRAVLLVILPKIKEIQDQSDNRNFRNSDFD